MKTFTPINKHIQIEPLEEQSYVASSQMTYEEKGTVIAIADDWSRAIPNKWAPFNVGDVVYFDSWVAAKYPDEGGNIRYLVPFDAIRAYERTDPLPTLGV